jgi:hypothetical protein
MHTPIQAHGKNLHASPALHRCRSAPYHHPKSLTVLQLSLTAIRNALLGWEPRYDSCRCDGFRPRTWHAITRNFVTYGGASQSLRPQIMPYAGAFGAAVASASWQPGNPNLLAKAIRE